MNDRRAAEAVGLNPDTAAYTKAKPRVRAYMLEHRAAVRERLVDHEAEGLRKLNIGRDQILNRLWELATLSHEATRGSIAGQMKALAMIAAIEGLIPSGTTRNRPVAPSAHAHIQAEAETGNVVAATKVQAAATRSHEPKSPPHPAPKPANNVSFPNLDRNHSSVLNPFIRPEKPNWIPGDAGSIFDAAVEAMNSLRLPFSPK
jgi:hypothetical protein